LLPDRLTWIDETNRDQHHFLAEDDRCLFFGDFYAGKGYSGGPTNQLIKNFKRTTSEINSSPKAKQLLHYKNAAITEVASALRKAFTPPLLARRTFVPLPSSKAPDHPDHCHRLLRSLTAAFIGHDADIRPLLRQSRSVDADHLSSRNRISYDDLFAITEIDHTQLRAPLGQEVVPPVAVKVYYVRTGTRPRIVGRPWHPGRAAKIVRLSSPLGAKVRLPKSEVLLPTA
jgi:hypothetical protein